MTDLLISDASQYQGAIDHRTLAAHLRATYGGAAGIFRVCYGDLQVDAQADANIDGARGAGFDVLGWYCYLIAGRAVEPQADTFCRVLQAHGGLRPAEFIDVDDEEGDGDQSGRVDAFLARCDANLKTPNPTGQDWWYSGLDFAIAHNLPSARGHRWIAAYQATEPAAVTHDLWQETDRATFPGIAGPVDASVFHGAIADLVALIAGRPLAAAPGGAMSSNIELPDLDIDGALWRIAHEEGTGHVWWGLHGGGEGGEDINAWVNDVSATVPTGAPPVVILVGTLGAAVHRYQGVKRVTISGRNVADDQCWQIVLQGDAPYGAIEPWHAIPLNVKLAGSPSGPKGDPGPDVRPQVASALEAAAKALGA